MSELISKVLIRGEVVEFKAGAKSIIPLTTEAGSALIVDLSGVGSLRHGPREVVLISDEIAGRTDTENIRPTETGIRRIQLSREGRGSQPLPQPQGGLVEVDLGRSALLQRPPLRFEDLE